MKTFVVAALLLVARESRSQQIDTARALSALRDAAEACNADGGRLWGKSLCGPIALVDRPTRLVIANDTVAGTRFLPYGNAFVTTLPANRFIANTSFPWGGRQWTMVALPLPADRYGRAALVLHETFHREQPALGLAQGDALNNHLDFREGRTWLRLELRALADAILAADVAQARRHTESALLFRAYRRSLYPGSDSTEASLEIQEGLPEYTGHKLAMALTGESSQRVAQHVADFAQSRSFVRSFAYGTGPGLGVVLDRFAPDWRTTVRTRRDLSAILAGAVLFRAPRDLERSARQRAAAYGLAQVDSTERAREAARAATMADFRARLSDGPVVTFRQTRDSLSWGFDPNSLIAFDLASAIYPFGSFTAPWGSLNVESNGVLVSNDLSRFRVPFSGEPPGPDTRQLGGNGWKATLNSGWSFAADPAKPGSFVVVRAAGGD
ncbi:MAG: hypothetical protein ACRENU_13615 [Gemmatimonadaceae bacterium]